MSESPVLHIDVLLPESVERKMRRWTANMAGASWPAWGGHITLAPPFTTDAYPDELAHAVTEVCAHFHPFEVRFTQPVARQDWTRRDHHAVFLAPDAVEDDGCVALLRLQRELEQTLQSLGAQNQSVVSQFTFYPHVTLALGVSEAEAAEIVRAIQRDGLRLEFLVQEIWMLAFDPNGDGRSPLLRRSFVLTGKDMT